MLFRSLPVENVERPKKWKELHEKFLEAVKMAQLCVGKDESQIIQTFVHIHPKWVEACDSYQLTRCRLPTGVDAPVLVRGTSIQHIADLGVTEFSETETWVHFRNSTGLVISCRRHLEDYPNLSSFLKIKGEPLTLPKGLAEAAETADIFSSENQQEENLVKVSLQPGKLKVYGKGVSGWYKETKKIKYTGDSLEFMISPLLLRDIVRRMNECEITEDHLKINGDGWVYIGCLSKEQEKENGNGQVEG